jgi:hypothetical protein
MTDEKKRPLSEARKKANAKYESKAYDKILLRIEAGKKDEIKSHADEFQPAVGAIGTAGYTPKGSINGFIIRAIDEKMERDKALKI